LMGDFPYLSEEQFLQAMPADALVVVLDRIQDPFNYGAIIRSAECLGMSGLLIGTAEQAGVNSQVARSSAGAVNYLPISRVDDLANIVAELSRRGWQICGTSERGESSIEQAEFRAPLVLVIGNEGAGLRPELSALCTLTVRIPMQGRVSSLNAAVSAGILCYAAANSCRVNRDR
jgi:23S rRNA (guanosine2251-2'-O)-methyltransferase